MDSGDSQEPLPNGSAADKIGSVEQVKGKAQMNTITEHEALTNMARGLNLTIHEKHETDGRKKRKRYFAQRGNVTSSPVLPFEGLNLFLMGWRRANK
jgi:hypothetical protein